MMANICVDNDYAKLLGCWHCLGCWTYCLHDDDDDELNDVFFVGARININDIHKKKIIWYRTGNDMENMTLKCW